MIVNTHTKRAMYSFEAGTNEARFSRNSTEIYHGIEKLKETWETKLDL